MEPLWPFVGGEFAFESAAWLALEIFLVDQVVAWTKKCGKIGIPSGLGPLEFLYVFYRYPASDEILSILEREGFLRPLKIALLTMI